MVYTLIETCKPNGVDPQAWLADVLARLPDHPAKRIDELLPWNWEAAGDISGLSPPTAGLRASSGTRSSMARFDRQKSVPWNMRATHDAIVVLTDDVCREHLDDEYAELARDMAAALRRKRPSPLASGQPRTCACAILYELGRVNFLSDRSSQPHMTLAELRAAFAVSQATASAKARVIANALRVRLFDAEWTLPSLRDQNPLVWMAEVNGLLVDLRQMPREVQEIAFEKGMIPYIPADRE